MNPKAGMITPWGTADSVQRIAPGIWRVATAGHGGLLLDDRHDAQVLRICPDFRPFAGAGWYEEDSDWSVVALCFPEVFGPEDLRLALSFAEDHVACPSVLRGIRFRIAAWERTNGHMWEVRSAMTDHDTCRVCFRRVRDGAERAESVRQIPTERLYSLADVVAMRS